MKFGSIFSASDKSLFDAFNQLTVTNSDIRHLFLNHGIVISKHTSREMLAFHFSRLFHDYSDFQALAKLFDKGHRAERLSSFRVTSKAQMSDFEAVAHELVAELGVELDAANLNLVNQTLELDIRYRTLHFNKSEFRQVEDRTAKITFEQEGGSIVIRGPQNDKVDDVCRRIISKIEANVEGKVEIDEINLESINKPELRTKFFVELITNMHGYKFHDVTDVYVFKQKSEVKTDISEEEDDDDAEVHLGVNIDRASLKGIGVLQTEEMQNLVTRGFFISKIVWQAKEPRFDSDIFEFEAQFSEPGTCTRFSYLPKGYYKYQADGRYSGSKSQLDYQDDQELSKVIESAARKSLQLVRFAAGDANGKG